MIKYFPSINVNANLCPSITLVTCGHITVFFFSLSVYLVCPHWISMLMPSVQRNLMTLKTLCKLYRLCIITVILSPSVLNGKMTLGIMIRGHTPCHHSKKMKQRKWTQTTRTVTMKIMCLIFVCGMFNTLRFCLQSSYGGLFKMPIIIIIIPI